METLTELLNGLKLFQDEDEFKFSVDAVVLADFIGQQKDKKILEIGGGTGVISLLLKGKDKLENSQITILEIQEKMAQLIEKNIRFNSCEDIMSVLNEDVKKHKISNHYDMIFSNPPYMAVDGKMQNISQGKKISRHEVELTLEELISNVKRVLKPRGEFYLVHRAYRLQEILALMSKYNLKVEEIEFCYSENKNEANLVLIKANKGMNKILKIKNPKYI